MASAFLHGMAAAKSEITEGLAPEALTMDDIMAVAKLADEIKRRSPFQLNEHIPEELDMILKIDGKFVMGKTKWRQFNSFVWPRDDEGAARWIAKQKVYDLDAIGKTANGFCGFPADTKKGNSPVAGLQGPGAVGGCMACPTGKDHKGET